jgi:protein-tyrosine phosphatase
MDHIYWVLEGLLAGRPGPTRAPWQPQALFDSGIRAVVSLAEEVQVEDLTPYGIEHFKGKFPPLTLYSEGMRKAFIYTALPVWRFIDAQIKASNPTIVHCFAGQDRTGVILSGYLVIYCGLDPKDAVTRVRNANPLAMREQGYEETVYLLQPNQLPDPRKLL